MRRLNEWVVTMAVLLPVLALTACTGEGGVLAGVQPPATVEDIEGSDIKRVILIERSAERLGIKTAPIGDEMVGNSLRLAMPYAALLYDEHGDTWAFTNPEGLVFVREHVTVDAIDGEVVILLEGPAIGTLVVTVGAAELYGTETGVGGL